MPEENIEKEDENPFGTFVLEESLDLEGPPLKDDSRRILEDASVVGVGFCRACGSTFGINTEGLARLIEEHGLSLEKESQYIAFHGCPQCKFGGDSGPEVLSF